MGESNCLSRKGCDVGDEAGGGAIGGDAPDGCVLNGLGLGVGRFAMLDTQVGLSDSSGESDYAECNIESRLSISSTVL